MEELIEELYKNVKHKTDEFFSVLQMQYGLDVDLTYELYAPVVYSFDYQNKNYDLFLHNTKKHFLTNQFGNNSLNNFVILNIDPVDLKTQSHVMQIINKQKYVIFENCFNLFIKSSTNNIRCVYVSATEVCKNFVRRNLTWFCKRITYMNDKFEINKL